MKQINFSRSPTSNKGYKEQLKNSKTAEYSRGHIIQTIVPDSVDDTYAGDVLSHPYTNSREIIVRVWSKWSRKSDVRRSPH